jgi:hypothetical protein
MYALFHFFLENSAGTGPTSLIKGFNEADCQVGDEVLVKWGAKRLYMAKIIKFGG